MLLFCLFWGRGREVRVSLWIEMKEGGGGGGWG